jgi:hypothetical protein
MRATRGMRERFDWGGRGAENLLLVCGVRSHEAARRCHRRMTVPMLAGSIATGRPATAPSHGAPTSDSSHTAIQPQTTTDGDRDEDDHQRLGAIRLGGAVVAREVRRHVHVRGHSLETELVALDVLHHEARLVVAIGRQ